MKLNKWGIEIIEEVLKEVLDLQKQTITGAERTKASREHMTNEQRKNDWEF